jgi:hypothetical protein
MFEPEWLGPIILQPRQKWREVKWNVMGPETFSRKYYIIQMLNRWLENLASNNQGFVVNFGF